MAADRYAVALESIERRLPDAEIIQHMVFVVPYFGFVIILLHLENEWLNSMITGHFDLKAFLDIPGYFAINGVVWALATFLDKLQR